MARLILIVILSMVGCSPAITPGELKSSKTEIPLPVETSRFRVHLVQVFDDPLAYNGQRGVYIIRDELNRKEYVGLSGIGISELGSHSDGESNLSDER